jgi:UPF0716 family protein affecting phage T7 exclusion
MTTFLALMLLIVFVQMHIIMSLHKRLVELENAPLDNRARNARGHFVANDPNTPQNEAYKPRKKARK